MGQRKILAYKKYIEEHSPETFLYVSLYGVSSYTQIEDAFFAQLHPLLASKGMQLAGKLLKGVIKTTIKVELDSSKKDELTLGGGLPDIRLPDYLTKLDGKTLVFDDLERCAIPIYQIMGYINQFVETNGIKVILVANEEEIVKLDDEQGKNDNAHRYLTIKEKLIGKSFEIETDIEMAMDDFIGLVENEECRKFLHSKSFLILLLFTMAGFQNLRHLKQALLDFDRFYQLLDKVVLDCDDLMNHLVNLFLLISFELKKGAIQEDDLEQLFSFSHLIGKDTGQKSKTQVIRAKYPIFNTYGFHPLSAETWTELFKAGTADRGKVNQELKESTYLSSKELPSWQRLYFFKDLKDEELDPVYKEVHREFTALTIDNPYYIVHITGIILFLAEQGLISADRSKIIQVGKDNFEALKRTGKLNLQFVSNFPGDHSHSMGYASLDNPEFKVFLAFATKVVQESELEKHPVKASELMALLGKSVKKFADKLNINDPANTDYTRYPVLGYIDAGQFADQWLRLPNADKIAVSDVLETRYSYSYDHRLQPERTWLQELLSILRVRKDEFTGKVSGYDLEHIIIPALQNSISRIPDG